MDWHYIKTAAPGGYRRFQHWLVRHCEGGLQYPAQVRQPGYFPWLYAFFEQEGILVNVAGTLVCGRPAYGYDLQPGPTPGGVPGGGYRTRPEAEAAAFRHAFALLDKRETAG